MKQSDINCTVIVPAAGQGKRFGKALPKQFFMLNNIPVIIRTLMIFDDMDEIKNIAIAVDPSYKKLLRDFIKQYQINKEITIIKGGKERQDSIFNAISLKPIQNCDIILVHDAVRPLATKELVKNIIAVTQKNGAAVPGLIPKDTIKKINPKGFVDSTLIRHLMRNIQTPQGFKKEIFLEIYSQLKLRKMQVTDDSSLAEMLGFKVKIVDGIEKNIKITTEIDLLLASSIISKGDN